MNNHDATISLNDRVSRQSAASPDRHVNWFQTLLKYNNFGGVCVGILLAVCSRTLPFLDNPDAAYAAPMPGDASAKSSRITLRSPRPIEPRGDHTDVPPAQQSPGLPKILPARKASDSPQPFRSLPDPALPVVEDLPDLPTSHIPPVQRSTEPLPAPLQQQPPRNAIRYSPTGTISDASRTAQRVFGSRQLALQTSSSQDTSGNQEKSVRPAEVPPIPIFPGRRPQQNSVDAVPAAPVPSALPPVELPPSGGTATPPSATPPLPEEVAPVQGSDSQVPWLNTVPEEQSGLITEDRSKAWSGYSGLSSPPPDGLAPAGPATASAADAPQLSPFDSNPGGYASFPAAPGTSGFRATVESDAPQWLGGYMGRAGRMPEGSENALIPQPEFRLPPDFEPWWNPLVRGQMGIAPKSLPVDASSLVRQAMRYSPQVLALQSEPEVLQRVVWQEEAAFDWRTFLSTTYDDLNDPVGNQLTTGNGDDRFLDNQFGASGGLRRRTESGGELELAQRIGHQYNNSRFLLPNPQSTSRLELSFRQPLLSRAGQVYNQNQIVLARIATSTSSDEVLNQLQTHLLQVTEAYWQMFRARAEFAQRQKLLSSSQAVLRTLEGRNQVDTIPRQILRARAAVAKAEARIQRSVTSIRNAESQLRLLVNDPEMLNQGPIEFLPVEAPLAVMQPTNLRSSLQTALINRPDVSRAIRQMRASSVRLGVSRNELLPKLDFIISTYVAGLEEQNSVPRLLGNQFADGGPGYTVGLEFELPVGNRAARARVEQRQWELQRSVNVFRATIESSLTEVEVSSREVETAYREMLGRFQAMTAAQNETNYLKDRFDTLPMAEDSAILLLEDLLEGFERLADEESAFVESQVACALSVIRMKKSMGVLLRSRHDEPHIATEESDWMAQRASAAAENTYVPDAPMPSVPSVPPVSVMPSTGPEMASRTVQVQQSGWQRYPRNSSRLQSIAPVSTVAEPSVAEPTFTQAPPERISSSAEPIGGHSQISTPGSASGP